MDKPIIASAHNDYRCGTFYRCYDCEFVEWVEWTGNKVETIDEN